jgi:hypothetical protein
MTTCMLKRAAAAIIAALILFIVSEDGGAFSAAGGSTSTGLTLQVWSYSAGYYSLYPLCLGEDDSHRRSWSGTLAPGESFTTTETFCTFEQRLGGPGGEGLGIWASGRNTLSLTATSPSGVVYDAHYLGSSRGHEYYGRCFLWFNGIPIEPGTWTVTLLNPNERLDRDVGLSVVAGMGDKNPAWQQANCPSVDWNF